MRIADDARVDRPIFLVGPPRSGTTLLYSCLASDPAVGYFNRANRKFPEHPRLARFLTRLGLYPDVPRESRALWTRFDARPARSAMRAAGDLPPGAREWYRTTVARILELRGARRFVAKLPAFSARLPWLDAIFPDALFLQCLRDWRAVVKSSVAKQSRDGKERFFAVKVAGWEQVKDLPFHQISAWQVRAVHELIESQERDFPGRIHRVWYEDLCQTPRETLAAVARSCGLAWGPGAEARLPTIRPPSRRDQQWLTEEMIAEIRAVQGDALRRYEYPQDAGP
jgi:hypothetical protein